MRRLPARPAVKLLVDVLLFLAATPLAFALGYEADFGPAGPMLIALAVLVPLKTLLALIIGLPHRSWTALTFRDLGSLVLLASTVVLIGIVGQALFGNSIAVPRSIPLLDGLMTFGLMAGARALTRYRHELGVARIIGPDLRKRVLVVGAGEAGALVVRELHKHPETGLEAVAFLDDDPRKQGQRVSGVPVMGALDDAANVIVTLGIDEVLIAMPSEGGRTVRRVLEQMRQAKPNLTYKIIPGLYQVLSGRVDVKHIREVEIDDLLGREPVELDTEPILGYLSGKRVMITGAGGSIGSELVRQICRFDPSELILFGHGENSIYTLERELDRDWPEVLYHGVIGAVQNGARLDYVFTRYRPDVVFHTAAHKHVPLMEENPEEAVFNNVIGSRNLIALALKHGVTHFVNISTDKAVNPTSVMGASKRTVELLVMDASRRAGPGQTFVSVRFGNVLGSRGSVIPIFKSQIAAGGPVTITDPEMVRYFMTIPEASQLVLQASANGRNGEVYILDMGEPVRIVDLARDLIRLSGFEPDVDIPISYTGIRPGERLVEELMTATERASQTAHQKIFVAHTETADPKALAATIDALQGAAMRSDHARIRALFEGFLEGCHLSPAVPDKDSEVRLPPEARLVS
ncbi:MAG TPA: nucleoside-diphosphate sugar epimerase/dehydratase [Trueperaceae bacterium]|nr:nucleoside-diphosphate sugar epimerase/dehydratase [Trueperaceae bacterium]